MTILQESEWLLHWRFAAFLSVGFKHRMGVGLNEESGRSSGTGCLEVKAEQRTWRQIPQHTACWPPVPIQVCGLPGTVGPSVGIASLGWPGQACCVSSPIGHCSPPFFPPLLPCLPPSFPPSHIRVPRPQQRDSPLHDFPAL